MKFFFVPLQLTGPHREHPRHGRGTKRRNSTQEKRQKMWIPLIPVSLHGIKSRAPVYAGLPQVYAHEYRGPLSTRPHRARLSHSENRGSCAKESDSLREDYSTVWHGRTRYKYRISQGTAPVPRCTSCGERGTTPVGATMALVQPSQRGGSRH